VSFFLSPFQIIFIIIPYNSTKSTLTLFPASVKSVISHQSAKADFAIVGAIPWRRPPGQV